MGTAEKRKNEVWDFAWWWFGVLGHDNPPQKDFRAMLGMAKNLKGRGYDLWLVRRAITTMIAHGVTPTTPYAVRWQSPERGKDWYEYSSPQMPPLWDFVPRVLHEEGHTPIRF